MIYLIPVFVLLWRVFVSILLEQMLKSIVSVLLTRCLDGAANPSVVRGVPCLPAWVARDFASDMAPVFRRICALSRDIFRFLTLGLLGLGGGDLSFFLVYIGLRWQSDAISK